MRSEQRRPANRLDIPFRLLLKKYAGASEETPAGWVQIRIMLNSVIVNTVGNAVVNVNVGMKFKSVNAKLATVAADWVFEIETPF